MGRISINLRGWKLFICRISYRFISSFSNSRQKRPSKVKESFHLTMLNISESSSFIFLRITSWGMYVLNVSERFEFIVLLNYYTGITRVMLKHNIICVAPLPLPPQCMSCFWGFLQPPFHWWLTSCTGWLLHRRHTPGYPGLHRVRRRRRSGLLQQPESPGHQSWCKRKSAVYFSHPRAE